MADFVLLHGTTQGPQGWDRLADALRALGHRAHAVDLLAAEREPAEACAEVVRAQLPRDLADAAVVAHSGAGLLLPAVAEALGARRQIWLAAAIPDGRRSLADALSDPSSDMFEPEWIGQDPTADPVLAAHFLFHDCTLEALRWGLGTLRRFVPAVVYRSVVAPRPAIASTYVVATLDRTIRPAWQRREAVRRLGAKVLEIDAGHCPHVSRPTETARLLELALR